MASGHIRKRSEGVYEVIVPLPPDPVTGRRRQMSRTVRGRLKDAQAVRATLLVELDAGLHGTADRTVGVLLDEWLDNAASDLSPTTLAAYRTYVHGHLKPLIGTRPLAKLDSRTIDALYRRLESSPHNLAPSSIHKAHNILHRALQQGVRWRWLARNPADDARPPRATRPSLTPPRPEQVRKLIAVATETDYSFGILLRLAAVTGARRGELCGLQWGDVGTQGVLTIRRTVVLTPTGPRTRQPKTAGSVRRIALDETTIEALKIHRDVMGWSPDDRYHGPATSFVFPASPLDGRTPMRPDGVTARFDRMRRLAGVTGVRFHDLRHFAATAMLSGGIDVRTTAGRLGHARASTTTDIYAGWAPARDQVAATVLSNLLDLDGE